MTVSSVSRIGISLLAWAAIFSAAAAHADPVIDWNIKAVELTVEAKQGAPIANRTMAIMHTAVFMAANAISGRYPGMTPKMDVPGGASLDAAVAAASRATLLKLMPAQQAAIDNAYQKAIAAIAEGSARNDGIAIGENAANAALAMRASDAAIAPESYRPLTSAGAYVPTVVPVLPQWPKRTPWLMKRADQFRPGSPPKLSSKLWARDYNEIKAFGAKNSTARSAEQTAIARFWETTGPAIYHGVVRSVASQAGRDTTQNARLFAAVSQASDDAIIAVFDAKYHYGFWRPFTAIRNGDIDGNKATERDPSWLPFIDTPMHPEYPCAHCISASVTAAVLRADVGTAPMPVLSTTSLTANGAQRSWTNLDDFVREVSEARIYDGVHYRNSTEVGTAMGYKVGGLAVDRFYQSGR